jgi:hypothetical protein
LDEKYLKKPYYLNISPNSVPGKGRDCGFYPKSIDVEL